MTAEIAHETAAVLRMYRAGMAPPQICGLLGMSKQQLIHELNSAIDQEHEAHREGMPIHDARIELKHEDTKQKYAKDIKVGEILSEHGGLVMETRPIYEGGNTPARIVFKLSTGMTFHYAPYDQVRFAEDTGG